MIGLRLRAEKPTETPYVISSAWDSTRDHWISYKYSIGPFFERAIKLPHQKRFDWGKVVKSLASGEYLPGERFSSTNIRNFEFKFEYYIFL